MLNKLNSNPTIPAVRSPMGPSLSNVLWGGFGEMDRLFDRLFHSFDQTLPASGWKAPLAVWEDNDSYYVEMELAGVTQDTVDVSVHDGQLWITYERQVPEGRQFIVNERPYGRFERRLALPESVNVDSIKAELRDGLLQVSLAKCPTAQPRKIPIQSR